MAVAAGAGFAAGLAAGGAVFWAGAGAGEGAVVVAGGVVAAAADQAGMSSDVHLRTAGMWQEKTQCYSERSKREGGKSMIIKDK